MWLITENRQSVDSSPKNLIVFFDLCVVEEQFAKMKV